MTESNFDSKSGDLFLEVMKNMPNGDELRRILNWKMEYDTTEALQSSKKEDVLKAGKELISKIYDAGIDSFRSPCSVAFVLSTAPVQSHDLLVNIDWAGRIPLVEKTREFRQKQALKVGKTFDPTKPSQDDLKLIEEASRFKFQPLILAIVTGLSPERIEKIQRILPPIDERQATLLNLKRDLHVAGLRSHSMMELMPGRVSPLAEEFLRRVFFRQFFTLSQEVLDPKEYRKMLGRIVYNCIALGTWAIGKNPDLKEKTLSLNFLPKELQEIPLRKYLKHQEDEILSECEQESMADYGGTIALQELTVDLLRNFLGKGSGYNAVSLSPYRDSSDPKLGVKGADIGLSYGLRMVGCIDLTTNSSRNAKKVNNPSGTQGDLPVIVLSIQGLKVPYIGENGQLRYGLYSTLIKSSGDFFRKRATASFEGVDENLVWEFRREIAKRMHEQLEKLVKDLGEEKLLGTPLGSNINEFRGFITRIQSGIQ